MDREAGKLILTQRGWLAATPADFRTALLSNFRWITVEAGAAITVAGETAGDMYGLARGAVEVTPLWGAASTPMLHIVHPVFWLGYGPMITGHPRQVTAIAKTRTWLAVVPQALVMRLLGEKPEWWRHFLALAMLYGDVAANVAADLLIRDSARRCAAVLLRFSGSRFDDAEELVDIVVTQDEVAAAANLSRNTAGTLLRKFAQRGLIDQGYRGIIVRKPKALRAFVDAE